MYILGAICDDGHLVFFQYVTYTKKTQNWYRMVY